MKLVTQYSSNLSLISNHTTLHKDNILQYFKKILIYPILISLQSLSLCTHRKYVINMLIQKKNNMSNFVISYSGRFPY